MTNQAILEKAIQKAIDGGWKQDKYAVLDSWTDAGIIFNHEFAKGLWGEETHEAQLPLDPYDAEDCPKCKGTWWDTPHYCWQYHLQQMVVAEDPIKYLEEHLDG